MLAPTVIEAIVKQHAEEAAFLWTQRARAAHAPHFKPHHLARLDERVEANLDGLRVAGKGGWRIAADHLSAHHEPGELFAASVLALESAEPDRIEAVVAIARAVPEARKGLIGALAWCKAPALATLIRCWSYSSEGFERYLALSACSVHRAEAGPQLAERCEDADSLVRARALRLAGELGRVEHLPRCIEHLSDDDPDVTFWAAWSAVLLGDRGEALASLARIALSKQATRWSALEVAVRAMGVERGKHFIGAISGDAGQHLTVTVALGHLGDPAAVPWLLARMDDLILAPLAGEAFAMITGADLTDDDLDRPPPTPLGETPPEASGGVAAREGDDHLPWPAADRIAIWWAEHQGGFRAGIRTLTGHPIGTPALQHLQREAFQRIRRAAAMELTLAVPGTALANCAGRRGSSVSWAS